MPARLLPTIALAVLLTARAVALPPAYPHLASAISTPYTTTAWPTKRDKPNSVSAAAPDAEKLLKAMPELKRGKHAMIIAGMSRLKDGVKQVEAAKADIRARLEAADKNVENVRARAAAGEFVTTERSNKPVVLPNGRVDYEYIRVDHGAEYVNSAIVSRNAFLRSAPKLLAKATASAMEQGRLEAWRAMVPHLDAVYPARKLPAGGLEVRVDSLRDTLTTTNRTAAPLTNLTLIVELMPHDTAPEAAGFQAYFLPKLDSGQTVWLAPLLARNCKPRQYPLRHPDHSDEQEGDHFEEWLSLDGLVEVRFTARAAEGRQAEQAVKFPDQAIREADKALAMLYRDLVLKAGRTPDKGQLARLARSPLWAFAQQTARRTLAYLPADAPPLCPGQAAA